MVVIVVISYDVVTVGVLVGVVDVVCVGVVVELELGVVDWELIIVDEEFCVVVVVFVFSPLCMFAAATARRIIKRTPAAIKMYLFCFSSMRGSPRQEYVGIDIYLPLLSLQKSVK